jgi:PP-loop superfamily ATP-utilizing enzyme
MLNNVKTKTSCAFIIRTTSSFSTQSTAAVSYDEEVLPPGQATELVDQLFERTYNLMMMTHPDKTMEQLQSQNHHINYQHIIAFSGGIDSSLVACLIHRIISGSGVNGIESMHGHHHHTAQAVLGISAAVSQEQQQLAERIANHIGIAFRTVPTQEASHPDYTANVGKACYACKSELYSKLNWFQQQQQQQQQQQSLHRPIRTQVSLAYSSTNDDNATCQTSTSSQNHQMVTITKLYNGTNADDVCDTTRVGLLAARDFRVESPISHISKRHVRIAARHLGLPHWNMAASPCLRSRLAYGVMATQDHLQTIERAERFVRQQLDKIMYIYTTRASTTTTTSTCSVNLRVRMLPRQAGCLEVDEALLPAVLEHYERNKSQWDAFFLQELGHVFRSFTIRAFRSGSVAATCISAAAAPTHHQFSKSIPNSASVS